MSKIRAFVAIPLPLDVQTLLDHVSQKWAGQLPERAVRWVKPHLMHITLRFLGDTDTQSIAALTQALDEVTNRSNPFTLKLAAPGCFPNARRPRVIWVGLHGHLDAAAALKQKIDQALQPLGWDLEDRSFRPHLTIGRVKDSGKVKGFLWEADIPELPIPVCSIHLIESDLQRSGPVYTIRHASSLNC